MQQESMDFMVGTASVIGILIFGIILSFVLFRKQYNVTATLTTICSLCIAWGLFVEPYRLVVTQFKITDKSLPSMRIAVVSDTHVRFGKSDAWIEKIVNRLQQQDFDILVITGDFLTSAATYASSFRVLENIKQPVYFVTGNHDYYMHGSNPETRIHKLRSTLQTYGLQELHNSAVKLNDAFYLVGIADNYLGYDDIGKAFSFAHTQQSDNHAMPSILLAHSPDVIEAIDTFYNKNVITTKPNLIISGHTHCGQVRFPFIGSISAVIPTENGNAYSKHYYHDKNLFVSCGLGESDAAIRFLNPPEINILDIN